MKARSRRVWVSRDKGGSESNVGDLWIGRPCIDRSGVYLPDSTVRHLTIIRFDCPTTRWFFGDVEPGTCRRAEIIVGQPGFLRAIKALVKAAARRGRGDMSYYGLNAAAEKVEELL